MPGNEWSLDEDKNNYLSLCMKGCLGPILRDVQPGLGWARSQRLGKKQSEGQALIPALGNWWTVVRKVFEIARVSQRVRREQLGSKSYWLDIWEQPGQTLYSKSVQVAQQRLHQQVETFWHDCKISGNPLRNRLDLSICIVLKWKHLKRYLMQIW